MGRRKITFFQHIAYLLEYAIVVPLASLLSLIPMKWLHTVSRPISWLFYKLNKKDKKWAYYNLDIVYKDNPLSKQEKDQIVRKLTHNVVRFGLEYLKMGRVRADNFHKYAYFVNYDESIMKLQKKGKGCIVVTLHLGNWEWMGSIPAKLGIDLAVVINRQFNPYTDAWLRWLREKRGQMKVFYNEITDMKKIARHLKKEDSVIALVSDQTYYFKPLIIPFFDVNCGTADGPARFSLKYNKPIVMCYSYRDEDGRYAMVFEDPVYFEQSDDIREDSKRIMTWVNKRYETFIREHIDQWFSLFHPRWERRTAEEFKELDFDPF